MVKLILMTAALLGTAVASEPRLVVPAASGPLTIDGVPDEAIWREAAVLPLQKPDFGAPFPDGGEMRAMVRSGYLCLSARIPETGRLVARSTGVNPAWSREDQVVWTVKFKAFAVAIKVTVNPLGAYSAEYIRNKEDPSRPVLASASAGPDGWSAEAAIPLESIAEIGFLSAERIRVPRPDAPELRYYWPGVNELLSYALRPGDAGRQAPPVERKEWWRPAAQPAPPPPGDALEADLRALPPAVWQDADPKPDQMWLANLRARVSAAALSERCEWEKVSTVADWERFRDPRIAALKKSLGPFPARTPLRAAITKRLDPGDGFAIENVIFESRPGLLVTANLYLPSKVSGRIPAVVIAHSLHYPKTELELQDMGMTWARNGTAVLVMDLLGAGERVQSQPWLREGNYSRYALGMQLYLAGESLLKWFVWDLMRGIDLLLERPYIDPKRVVMLGAVAGGGDPAAVTGVLDSRIVVVVPFNFGEAGPEEHYTQGPRPYDPQTADPGWGEWESTRCLRQSIAGQFFPWLICAARAPRPFLFSFEIGWPENVEKEAAWARYKKVYDLYGQRGHLAYVDGYGPFTGPGEVENVGSDLRRKFYPTLKRWLDLTVPAAEYHNPRPDAELMCLTPQAAAERRPKTASELAAALAEARLAAARAKRAGLAAAERVRSLRAALKEKLGDIEPGDAGSARVLSTKPFSGFTAEAVLLESAPGIKVPLMLIKPAGTAAAPLPVVLALGQGGKATFLAGRSAALSALLKQGVAVCLADVRGTGETGRAGARGSSSTSFAATELMLGETALGGRLKDARTVVRYLARRGDLDAQRLLIWGDSSAGVNPRGMTLDQSIFQQQGVPQAIRQAEPAGALLALLTALYEDGVRAVAARGGLLSYQSVLRDRFCYVPLDSIVPGILETADTADLVSALAPRGVLLARLVDGRNRAATPEEANREYRMALGGHLTIRDDIPDAELARWIGAQVKP
jgi:hypothetical protein